MLIIIFILHNVVCLNFCESLHTENTLRPYKTWQIQTNEFVRVSKSTWLQNFPTCELILKIIWKIIHWRLFPGADQDPQIREGGGGGSATGSIHCICVDAINAYVCTPIYAFNNLSGLA